MKSTDRRNFLKTTGAIITGSILLGNKPYIEAAKPIKQSKKKYKAAIIGKNGDYGHDLDKVFNNLDNVTVVAVADNDPVGLKKTAKSTGGTTTIP